MRAFLKIVDWLTMMGAGIAAVSLAALVILGSLEIALRNLVGISLQFVTEYNGYLLALTFLGGAAQAMREGGHIRVTMLMQALPKNVAKYLDVVCTMTGLVIAGCLGTAMWQLAYGSFTYGTVSFFASQTPLVYPQAAVAILIAVFFLSLVARLARLLTNEAPDRPSTGHLEIG